jgi:hypothetical protein
MKKQTFATALSLLCLISSTVLAGKSSWTPVAGARLYGGHSAFDDLPFSQGDIGYVVGVEYPDSSGLLQMLLTYAPSLDGEKWRELEREQVVDYVVTPEISMLAVDAGWRAGAGLMSSYIVTEQDEEWTSLYYQFQMGYALGRDRLKLSAKADYTFEGIGELKDFDFSDIDFSLLLHLSF